MGIVKVNRNPKHLDKKIYHRKKKLSMKKPSMKKPLVKRERVIVNTVDTVNIPTANMNYEPEVLRKADDCVSIGDINDDSQKTTTKVERHGAAAELFVLCRDSLLDPGLLDCPANEESFISIFRNFVSDQFEKYKILDINKDTQDEKNICCIPFTNLPIRVNVGSVFNDIMYFIPDDPTGRRLKSFIKDKTGYRWNSFSNELFFKFKDLFYNKGKKIIKS